MQEKILEHSFYECHDRVKQASALCAVPTLFARCEVTAFINATSAGLRIIYYVRGSNNAYKR